MQTAVDRALPDTGTNRSVLQRFLQLLHDANGLTACSKDGAVAHVPLTYGGVNFPSFDYPTNPLTDAVCGLLGAPVNKHIKECGILRFDNVAALIIKVALGKYEVDVRDPCLKALMNSSLVNIVGGADNFLNSISGINGFGVHPTVQGVARLAFFDVPYTEWGGFSGDNYYPKTRDFLKDVIAPVPSMVCPVAITQDPADGSAISIRRCERYEDTLRGRDPNGLFPLEQLGFLEAVQPFAQAFDQHDATPVFVSFLDVLHRHWGTAEQSKDECDPSLPKSHARWCSQDGVSAYEPMLADMLTEVNLFGELSDIVKIVEQTTLPHCEARDAQGLCQSVSQRDGLTIVSEAVRALVDPARSAGLTDRRGATRAVRNDGTEGTTLTPAQLWLGALSEIRKNFGGQSRAVWLKARSQIIDTLLQVEDREQKPRFKLEALDVALPQALLLLRQQLLAHCPVPGEGAECGWVKASLRDISEAVESPVTARVVDVLNALRADEASRNEIGLLASHLFGLDDPNAHASTVAAFMDFLQVLDDDESMRPLAGLLAQALSSENPDEKNVLAKRTLDLLARFFAAPEGGQCAGVDPHHAFAYVFTKAVTPLGEGKRAPVEVLIDSALRVNRKNPRERTAMQPEDMQSLGKELAALMLDPASGLEQLYAVLKQISDEHP
jgi:hypothetical protein